MEFERLHQSCNFQIHKFTAKIASKSYEPFPNWLKQCWLSFCLSICCNQPQIRNRWQMLYLWSVAPIIAKKTSNPWQGFIGAYIHGEQSMWSRNFCLLRCHFGHYMKSNILFRWPQHWILFLPFRKNAKKFRNNSWLS